MEPETVYVGIDVSKTCVDVAVRPTGQMWTISNDESGIREPVSRLKALDPAMVVLEGLVFSYDRWPISHVFPQQLPHPS